MVFSTQVGAECIGGAYAAANLLPNLLFEVVAGGALASAVVPLLAGPLTRSSREEIDKIVSALIGWVLVVLVPLSVLLALLAVPLSKILITENPDCGGGQQELVARMISVFAPQIALYGIGVVLTGTLNAHRRFFWPAAAPLLSSIVVVGAYFAFGATNQGARTVENLPGTAEAWLAWGTTAGVAVMTLPLLWPAYRAGVRIRPTLTFPPGVARRGLALASAGIAALLAQQAALLTAMLLGSRSGDTGAFVVFQYTQAVYFLPYAVLAVPLATSAFPRLAESASTGDEAGFAATAASSTRVVVLVSLFGTAVLAGVAVAVGEFFTGIDAAKKASVSLGEMGNALTVMAPGLVGFALIAHIGRALYARERGRAAAVATSLGWAAVIVGSIAGVQMAPTVTGLAWGNTIGMVVAAALLVVALRRVAGAASTAGLARLLLLAGVATVVAAVAGREISYLVLDGRQSTVILSLFAGVVAATVSAVVFAGLLAVLDRKNLGMLIGRITRKA
nr:lipid II flippase MurJ [Kineosporia babensis]